MKILSTLIMVSFLASCVTMPPPKRQPMPTKPIMTKQERRQECIKVFYGLGMNYKEALSVCKFIEGV